MRNKFFCCRRCRFYFAAILCGIYFSLINEYSFGQAFYRNVQMVQLDAGWGGYYKQLGITNTEDSLFDLKEPGNVLKTTNLKSTRMGSNSYGIHYEFGVADWRKGGSMGVGVYAGLRRFIARSPNESSPIGFREVWLRYYQTALECKYHFYTKNRWDPYINGTIGVQWRAYRNINVGTNFTNYAPQNQVKNPKAKFMGQLSFGSRYYIYNNISIFAEGGFGVYYVKIGLSFIVKP